MKANRSPRRDTYSSLGPRVDPLRTCRQFIASLCPGHKTGHKQNGKLFFPCIGCFICILMNFSTVDSSFSSIFMASTRTKITFRSLCMYAKTYAGYIIPKGRVPVFFVPNSFWATKGHGRGRRSLVLARDVGTSFLWFRSPWNNGTN